MTEWNDSPAWLNEAISRAARPSEAAFREEAPSDVLPGDLCVVGPYELAGSIGRLFLVTDSTDGWCEGMLVSAETELATEVDPILDPNDTGVSYDVVVHSRYLGSIWTAQVRRRVGATSTDVLDQVMALAWNDEPNDVSLRVGLPLQPEGVDPRYGALIALSAELDGLTDHWRRRNHDLGPVLDPALADLDVLQAMLCETGWETRIAAAVATPDFRDRLLAAFPSLTRDQQRAAMPFLELAASSAPTATSEAAGEIDGHRDPAALLRAIASQARSQPAVTVLSHWRCGIGVRSPLRIRTGGGETTVVIYAITEVHLAEVA